jgi:hypothetical protein
VRGEGGYGDERKVWPARRRCLFLLVSSGATQHNFQSTAAAVSLGEWRWKLDIPFRGGGGGGVGARPGGSDKEEPLHES